MKNKALNMLIILGYCVPYAFLSMYEDITNRSMLLYCVMIVAMGLLCWATIKRNNIYLLVVGNILSCVVSCICINIFRTEKWSWYFKPFTAIQLAIVISAVALIIHVLAWVASKKRITNPGFSKSLTFF